MSTKTDVRDDAPEHKPEFTPDRVNGAPLPEEGDVVVFVDNKLNQEDKFFRKLIGYEFVTQMANDESVKIKDHHYGWFTAWLHRVRLVARCTPVQPFKTYEIVTKVTKELIAAAKRDRFMLVVRCVQGDLASENAQTQSILADATAGGVSESDLNWIAVMRAPKEMSDEAFEEEVRKRFHES